jgi:hypothetical protein
VWGKDLILGNYSPAERSEKACGKGPELVSGLLQGLMINTAAENGSVFIFCLMDTNNKI